MRPREMTSGQCLRRRPSFLQLFLIVFSRKHRLDSRRMTAVNKAKPQTQPNPQVPIQISSHPLPPTNMTEPLTTQDSAAHIHISRNQNANVPFLTIHIIEYPATRGLWRLCDSQVGMSTLESYCFFRIASYKFMTPAIAAPVMIPW
jgi:hypothetical protein